MGVGDYDVSGLEVGCPVVVVLFVGTIVAFLAAHLRKALASVWSVILTLDLLNPLVGL